MRLGYYAALSAAWAMEEAALRGLLEIAACEHEVKPEALEAYRAKSLEKAERATVRNGVAIIDLAGPLFKRGNLFTEMSGATSYELVRRDFQAALDDGNVRAILLNIDSPGGEAAGCAELAAAIFDARGMKPIVAYAGDLMASAAYWIGSAADRIVVGASAAVGSIGVRASIADTSAREARSGVTTYTFVSSQSPFKVSDPTTEDGAGRLQARVDALAAVFVETVAENRGVSVAHVLDAFGKGDVKVGQAAITAGMADAFGTFEGVLASLASESDPLAAFPKKDRLPTFATRPSAVDLALDRVRAAAVAHHAAQKAAEARAAAEAARRAREEDAAVEAILAASAFARTGKPIARVPDAADAAVAAIFDAAHAARALGLT